MENQQVKISIKKLNKRIHKNQIIQDINVDFKGGKIYGLKGYNGSGKTMLMRLIAGLILPTDGEILINGRRLGKDITFPDRIGILIENPSFLDGYTGYENLKLLADIQKRIDSVKIRKVLEQVGLDPDDKRKYRKYSLGMKQRLGIAAAVMEGNDILLIDEPTNALDTEGIVMVKDLLRREKERGALVIIACHEPAIIQELSDEIYTIENGRFVDHVVL